MKCECPEAIKDEVKTKRVPEGHWRLFAYSDSQQCLLSWMLYHFLANFFFQLVVFFFHLFLPFMLWQEIFFVHITCHPTFWWGARDAPMSFKRLKAIRNEELFLVDLIHLCCIWAIIKYIKLNVIIFAWNVGGSFWWVGKLTFFLLVCTVLGVVKLNYRYWKSSRI